MRFLISALLMLASAAFGQTNNFPLDINYAGGQLRLSGGTVAGGLFTNATNLLHLTDWNTATKGITINMSSGAVGIGTHSPDGKLNVSGTGTIITQISSDATTTSRALLGLNRGSSTWHMGMNVNQSGTNDLQFRFAGGYHFTIST